MVTTRSSSGMKAKHSKGEIFSATCYQKIKGYGTHVLAPHCKVKLESNRKAVITKDGRVVKKIGGRWVYIAK